MNKSFKKLMILALAAVLMLSVLMLPAAADNDDPAAVTAPNPEDMQILSAPAPDSEPVLGAAPAPDAKPAAPDELPANDLTPPDAVLLPEGEYVLPAPVDDAAPVAIEPDGKAAPEPKGVPENAVDVSAPAPDAAESDGGALVWVIVAAVVVVAAVAFLVIKKKK